MMIKFENTEVIGWEHAIRGMRAKGYRQTANGRYEAFVSDKGRTVCLGTYDTVEEAKNAVFYYRANRLISEIEKYGLNIDESKVFEGRYLAFRNGMIFNLYGERMVGGVDRGGYRHGLFNGRNRDHHKIIAECFIPNPNDLRDVNHKNGNKLDIDVSNLERITHSDNVLHAYRIGLTKKICGEDHHAHKFTWDDIRYIRRVYSKRDSHYGAVALANKYGVDRTTIYDIVNGRTWREENDQV